MIIKKFINGELIDFNDQTNKYLNPHTGKWIVKYRQPAKGQAKGKAKGQAKGQAKGKAINKSIQIIPECEREIFYYSFESEIFDSLTPEISERINFFLFQIERKYLRFNHMNNEYNEENIFEKDKETTVYFTLKELDSILTQKNKYAYINWLEANGLIKKMDEKMEFIVINEKKSYLDTEKTLHKYIPTPLLLSLSKKKSYITYLRVSNSIKRYYAIIEQQLGDYKPLYMKQYKTHFNINKQQFDFIMTDKYTTYKEEKESSNKPFMSLVNYLKENNYLFDMIMAFNENNKYNNLNYFKVDSFSGRVHSIFTYLPSSIVMTNTSFQREIDLKQSQMILLAQLLFDRIGDNSFTTDINNGVDVYQLMANKLGVSRKQGKEFMFRLVFGNVYDKAFSVFKEIWGDAAEYIYQLKTTDNPDIRAYYNRTGKKYKRYAVLCMLLQKKELSIFKDVWQACSRYTIATRHDSICCSDCDYENVKKIMTDILEQHLTVRFELK